MTSDQIDRLTPAERDVLSLLASGHDTKTAAVELRISIHAVNDRLREARRKLNVTSSREAARILAGHQNQKNWGKFSGGDAVSQQCADQPRRKVALFLVTGVLTMSLVLLAAMLWSSGGSAAASPHVVAVSPAKGAIIAPGPFSLTVTYDRPMRDNSWSFVQVSQGSYPDCQGSPVRSADGRSFTLSCIAKPGMRYEVWFNRGKFRNFRSIDGASAMPFGLKFAVKP